MTKSIGKVCLVFALLFGILSVFFLFQRNIAREEKNSYRQQLIALCASINHAEFESVSVVKDDLRSERLSGKPVLVLFIGKEDFFISKEDLEVEGKMYTIYPDGRVIFFGYDAKGNSFEGKEDWGDHPDFSFLKK